MLWDFGQQILTFSFSKMSFKEYQPFYSFVSICFRTKNMGIMKSPQTTQSDQNGLLVLAINNGAMVT